MAFTSLPSPIRAILGAGLAVMLPVLLTGCDETSGGQSAAAGPGLFGIASSPSSGPPLASPPGSPAPGDSFLGGSFTGPGAGGINRTIGAGSPQWFSSQRTGLLPFLPSGPAPAAPQPRPTDSVPGPLPVLGAAAAFGCSRRLRRRIRHGS